MFDFIIEIVIIVIITNYKNKMSSLIKDEFLNILINNLNSKIFFLLEINNKTNILNCKILFIAKQNNKLKTIL